METTTTALTFLPSWPPQANGLILFGAILLLGLLGGRLAAATRILPAITGYIATGFILGPGGLNWLTADTLQMNFKVLTSKLKEYGLE